MLIEASKRLLREPTAQIPARSVTRIACVSLSDLDPDLAFSDLAAGYVERIFEAEGRSFDLRLCLKNLPDGAVVTTSDVFEDLNYRAQLDSASQHTIRLTVDADGTVDGFLVWLHLIVDAEHPEEAVDILDSKGSWLPVFLPLDVPLTALTACYTIVAEIDRSLCANRLNPDFRITGSVTRGDTVIAAFTCDAPHVADGFRGNRFHRAAFDAHGRPRRADPPGEALRQHLEQTLPAYMVPAHLMLVDRMPLTASGKIDRAALPAPARGSKAAAIAPRDDR